MNPQVKQFSKRGFVLVITLLFSLLSGCSSIDDENQLTNKVNPERIQEALRSKAYSSWDQKFQIGQGSGENLPSVDFESSEISGTSNNIDNFAPEGIDINQWRKEISSPWAEIPDDKFDFLCKVWFDWFMDPISAGGNIGERFQYIKDNLKQMSLVPYAFDQITLIQDNRKTIPYPREGKPSELVVCRAEVTFETTFGTFNRSHVYLTAKYVLIDGKAVFSFPNYSSREIAK